MPQIYSSARRQWFFYALLTLFASLPFLRLMWGEYLYDDVTHIELNQNLQKVKTLSDVIAFKMQPSRPISGWTMAVVQWLSGGALWAHRFASLLLHIATTLLVYVTVRALHNAKGMTASYGVALFVAFAFAIHPLQSEVIAVGSFRWEQWAAIASFLCINITLALCKEERESLWCALFFTLGLAFLSKETFSILAPIAILSVFSYMEKLTKQVFLRVAAMTIPWGLLLFCLLQQPTDFTYAGILGVGAHNLFELYGASANAFVEQGYKMLSGQKLVFSRLFERQGILGPLTVPQSTAIFLAGFGLWYASWKQKDLIRFWGMLFFSGTFLYLAIPNFNVGSQHYYYYLLTSFLSLLASVAWKLASRNLRSPVLVVSTIAGTYLLVQFGALQSRILDFRSRKDFNLAELRTHPESAMAWLQMIDYHRAQNPKFEIPEQAWPLVVEAHKRFPEKQYFASFYSQFLFAHGKLDDGLQLALRIVKNSGPLDAVNLGMAFASSAAKAGDCLGSQRLIELTLERDPQNADAAAALKSVAKVISKTPDKCVRL